MIQKKTNKSVDELASASTAINCKQYEVKVETEILNSFDELITKSKNIQLPDDRWSVAKIADHLLITHWNRVYECEKRIIIDQNLNIKVSTRIYMKRDFYNS